MYILGNFDDDTKKYHEKVDRIIGSSNSEEFKVTMDSFFRHFLVDKNIYTCRIEYFHDQKYFDLKLIDDIPFIFVSGTMYCKGKDLFKLLIKIKELFPDKYDDLVIDTDNNLTREDIENVISLKNNEDFESIINMVTHDQLDVIKSIFKWK